MTKTLSRLDTLLKDIRFHLPGNENYDGLFDNPKNKYARKKENVENVVTTLDEETLRKEGGAFSNFTMSKDKAFPHNTCFFRN